MLIQMPLTDFEALVEKARQTQRLNKVLPALAVSTYQAELVGTSLSGKGTWIVSNQERKGEGRKGEGEKGRGRRGKGRKGEGEKSEGPEGQSLSPSPLLPLSASPLLPFSPLFFPCPVLNLALNNVKNKTSGGKAILGLVDGKNLGLVLDQAGSQTITFDWSAHGTATPSGLHFDLKLPSCPQGSIELKLPADHVVSLPFPVGEKEKVGRTFVRSPRHRRSSDAALATRPDGQEPDRTRHPAADRFAKRQPPTQLVQIVSRQEIALDTVKADFEFQVDVPLRPVSELVFDCDPSLAPYEVSLASPEMLSWKLDGTRLTIQAARAFPGNVDGAADSLSGPSPGRRPVDQPFSSAAQAVSLTRSPS